LLYCHVVSLKDCVGPVLPQTTVSIPGSDGIMCSDTTEDTTVSHALQLGVHCRNDDEDLVVFSDLFVDCINESPIFALYTEFGSNDVNIDDLAQLRYTCLESVSVPTGSKQPQSIRHLAMSTDLFWSHTPDDRCYTMTRASSNTTSDADTQVPSASPPTVTLDTPREPVLAPMPVPVEVPNTMVPPTASQVAPVTAASPNTEKEFPVGTAVGSIVAAIIVAGAIVALAIWWRSPQPPPNAKQQEVANPSLHADRDHSDTAQTSADVETNGGTRQQNNNAQQVWDHDSTDSLSNSMVYSTYAVPVTVVASAEGNVAHAVAERHFPHSSPIPTIPPVQYKDQARSVLYQVPMTNVQPMGLGAEIIATAVPYHSAVFNRNDSRGTNETEASDGFAFSSTQSATERQQMVEL
jgi:hypothetical protein